MDTVERTVVQPGRARGPRKQEPERAVLYGDFTCPASYLASLRLDRRLAAGLPAPDWRAVEHRPSLPLNGVRLSGGARTTRTAEVGRVRALLREGEAFPVSVPALLPHSAAAALVYAEAYRIGVADIVRPTLFHAYWVDGRDIGEVGVLRDLLGEAVGRRSTWIQDRSVELASTWQEEWLGLGGSVALTWATRTRTLVGRPVLRRIEPNHPGADAPAA